MERREIYKRRMEKYKRRRVVTSSLGKAFSCFLLISLGCIGCMTGLFFTALMGNIGRKEKKEIVVVHTNEINEELDLVENTIVANEPENGEIIYEEPMEEQSEDTEMVVTREEEGIFQTEEAETLYDVTEEGIHRYEYYMDDCTWTQALNKAVAMGGYLLRINNEEEFDYICNQISGSAFDSMVIFHIGGRRNSGEYDYYWVDENNVLYGECLNSSTSWTNGHWMTNEPSYTDSYDNKSIDEDKLVLYKLNGVWALNDSADGVVSWYPPYAGKVGFIVEYDD